MAYLSLYLKYRPRTFQGLLGQQHVARTLQNAVALERVAHAYLFTGPRGTGKTTAARILARALNCEKGPTPNPCGECSACRRIMDDACLDVVEVDAASRRRVEETSELLSTVVFLPAEVRYKVYVIDEVHMLSTHAFNSLLKTLEEPPSHVVFVLATTEVHKVPATIVSRCQRFDFRRIGLGDLLGLIRGIAEKEGMEAEEEALGFLAEAADGSARDAISLLEQAASYGGNKITLNDVIYIVGSTEENVLGDLVRLAWEGEIQGGLELIDKQMLMGRDAALFLRELAEYLRDCLVVKLGGKGRRYVRENGAGPWLQSVEKGTLISLIEIVGKAAEELRWSSQHRLLCEVAFIRMSEALPGKPELSGPAAEGEVPKESTAGEEPAESGAEQGWRKVIQALEKDKAIPLVQLAEDARPSWDGDGNLVLAFGYQFSKEEFERRLLEEMEDAAYVDKLLLQAFGRRVTVMCRMSGPEVPKSVKAVFPESRLVRGNWG